ncbi:hypothetical protein DFJ74DRAFT_703810 [Hyaloraphidium curvatum]|nr:hypothetical protein DFJ74DRAFT_703810 [Hyaloraphidium curvatum]
MRFIAPGAHEAYASDARKHGFKRSLANRPPRPDTEVSDDGNRGHGKASDGKQRVRLESMADEGEIYEEEGISAPATKRRTLSTSEPLGTVSSASSSGLAGRMLPSMVDEPIGDADVPRHHSETNPGDVSAARRQSGDGATEVGYSDDDGGSQGTDNEEVGAKRLKSHVCEVAGCHKAYKDLSGLRYHQRNAHQIEHYRRRANIDKSKYPCMVPNCTKTYGTLAGRRYHYNQHHTYQEVEAATLLEGPKRKGGKRYRHPEERHFSDNLDTRFASKRAVFA